MNIKTAFANAVAKHPERERRVALASFVGRYSQPWPISDYRCVGLDADIIKSFLGECGFRLGANYEDVVSVLDPEAHQLRWLDEDLIRRLAASLASMLPSPAERVRLYVAQIDRQPDPAPGLTDERGAAVDDPFWDPLELYGHTERLAEAMKDAADAAGDWARAWLAKRKTDRDVMAPLWVIEASRPAEARLGLFVPTTRTPRGRTAHIPFLLGRYACRNERLTPVFPTLASMPVANLWGNADLHDAVCPLEGYVSRTVRDLMDIPPDTARTAASSRRDTWAQVESAYVSVDNVATLEQVAALVRPAKLWRYVAELYEAAYEHRIALLPDMCRVHVGRTETGNDHATVSTLDQDVQRGGRLEIRPAFVMLNEPPVPGAPHGESKVSADERGLAVLPDDPPSPEDAGWTHDSERFTDSLRDVAAEWYLMSHANVNLGILTGPERTSGGIDGSVAKFRKWIAEAAHRPEDTTLPDDVALDSGYEDGYNAPAHIVCSIIDDFRRSFNCMDYTSPDTSAWQGSLPELHMSAQPVVAVWSGVLGEGSPVPSLLFKKHTPQTVTSALDKLADPAVQLATPAHPEVVQIVVETNIRYPSGGLREADMGDYLRNLFLWGFQANRYKDHRLTILQRNCQIKVHRAMMDELQRLNVPHWSALWASNEHIGRDCEWHLSESNYEDTHVNVLKDMHGRMVLVFGAKVGSPAECVCRAAFRYYAGLPLLSNEGMDVAVQFQRERRIAVSAREPGKALVNLIRAHASGECMGVVAGWTDWSSPWARQYIRHTVPERSDYTTPPGAHVPPFTPEDAADTAAGA